MTQSAADLLQLVEDCERRESRLDDWQRSFIASMREQLERGAFISKTQIEKLEEAWDRATERG